MTTGAATDYISLIAGTEVTVTRVTPQCAQALRALPEDLAQARATDGDIVLVAPDESVLGALLERLRDVGMAFSYGPGWSPSAVFAELRDR